MSTPQRFSLPEKKGLYYGGDWHPPRAGGFSPTYSPTDGREIANVASGDAEDVDCAVAAAAEGYAVWRHVEPLARAAVLRDVATVIRQHGEELAWLDAYNGGNPLRELKADIAASAALFEFFAGLVTEMKGASLPMGPGSVNFSVREPRGVIARLVAFNHPFMFTAAKAAAPLAAGNSVIMKPPEQAPLSALRFADLIGGLFPPGVFSVLPGGAAVGEALARHPGIAMIGLIGSVATGRAVMRAASETLKPVIFELGGKNALIAYPDADPDAVADAMIGGMNFGWCGQSCGSTSRVFLHEAIHDRVIERVRTKIASIRPGVPTDPETSMGAIVSKTQLDKILGFIQSGRAEGASLLCGGERVLEPLLAEGWFLGPTIFVGVVPSMRIAREEIFGPVLSVLRWSDHAQMLRDVNAVDYGLTCSIWTNDLSTAHRTAAEVQAGFVWINEVSRHFIGAPFGGYKQSGIGREECLEELIAFTQEKNIHIRLAPPSTPATVRS
ncbi:MAG: aldehyde dehydrogenase family protein [Caulobacterales bacterium]